MELRGFVLYRQATVYLSDGQLPVYIVVWGFMSSSSLGLLLRLVHQHWTQAVEAALEEAGYGDIRPPHANVFTFARPEGIQVSELTKLARVRKQTMTQAVEELERLGYVERRPDPDDRRARLVFLTEKGQGVRPVAMAAGRRVDESWAALTGQQQMDDLRTALRRLLEQLQ
ncbi:DNA-binding MarR family transcriptional regulator [Rhizobium pisi]|uniref:MarR family transcriptional regulator n=1 Tax=Rhizobium pisi TaxID=574561 RepID=A0A427N0V4_9HYPH|nr:MarR family winged helix-turn-helix transcriptional regulator [Rhizobium pisi]RSB79467.1 MarR family transcriptional regulator [Rhizobium pisi]TCA59362.1 MarR family transcriptional regulator [Rhizobium pisi]